jgi:hypothetical protein
MPAKRLTAKSAKRPKLATKPAAKPAKPSASAPVDAIAWTDKLRGKTFATRARPNPLHLSGGMDDGPTWVPDDTPYPYDVDAAWTAALDRTWSLAEWARPPNSIPVGLPNATPVLAAHARAALAAFGKRLDALDAETEAAMMVLELRASWTCIPLWIATQGIAFATRALVTAARWRNNEGATGKHREQGLFLVEDGTCAGREVHEHSTAWRLLRGALALADENDYAEARGIANAARKTLPFELHAAIAFAFPDEPWCKDAIDGYLAAEAADIDTSDAWESWQMLIATAEIDDAIRIARMEYPLHLPFAMTMLAKHGLETPRLVAAMFDTFAQTSRFTILGDVLAMIRTREALEAFLPVLGISAVKGPMARAFKAQPELGKKLLAKPAKKADKAGKAAAALLAKL